jgi:hypothetical protein
VSGDAATHGSIDVFAILGLLTEPANLRVLGLTAPGGHRE